jgi:hypothetical protein
MSASKTIAETRKRNKRKPWTHRDAAAQCLKRRGQLTRWEVKFCTDLQDFQRVSGKQVETLLFCCEKTGVDWDPDHREPGDDG